MAAQKQGRGGQRYQGMMDACHAGRHGFPGVMPITVQARGAAHRHCVIDNTVRAFAAVGNPIMIQAG